MNLFKLGKNEKLSKPNNASESVVVVAVGCWYFVVDISQELDLITTGQQSHSVRRRKWPASPHSAL